MWTCVGWGRVGGMCPTAVCVVGGGICTTAVLLLWLPTYLHMTLASDPGLPPSTWPWST